MLFSEFEEQEILSNSGLTAHLPTEALLAVKRQYQEPHRHYHDWQHALSVIGWVNYCVRTPLAYYTSLEFALAALYHDAVYDPKSGSPTNELASIDFMKVQIKGSVLDQYPGSLERVEKLIGLTAKHGKLSSRDVTLDEALFLDCDMASFGERRWETVLWNEVNIQAEYLSLYTPEQVKIGRRHFLTGLLNKESVFLSQHFQDLYESQAHHNIRRVLATLNG